MRARVLGVVVAASAACAGVARADDAACVRDASALRARLTGEAHRARAWNLGWGLGFAAASAGQLALAAADWNPLGEADRGYRDQLYVGAGKAGLGALARLVTPLRVDVPAPVADACADLAALHAAQARAGRLERRLFWTSDLGALLVNLGGAVILGERDSWTTGAVTFAYGYPVGLASTYTMPRASWHAWRSLEVTSLAPAAVRGGGAALAVGGRF